MHRLISTPLFHCCHLVVLYSSRLDLYMLPVSLVSDLRCSSSRPFFLSFHPALPSSLSTLCFFFFFWSCNSVSLFFDALCFLSLITLTISPTYFLYHKGINIHQRRQYCDWFSEWDMLYISPNTWKLLPCLRTLTISQELQLQGCNLTHILIIGELLSL